MELLHCFALEVRLEFLTRPYGIGLFFVLSLVSLFSFPSSLFFLPLSLVVMSTQRVPAWKRLGLKLKGSASDESPASSTKGNANANQNQSPRPNAAHVNGSGTPGNKRNLTPSTPYSDSYQHANKRLRTGGPDFGSHDRDFSSSLRRQKSVSFVDGTKESPARPSATTATPNGKKKPAKKPKKKKSKKDPDAAPAPNPDFDLTPTLTYLRLWATDRESWKFNKNHQTLLIKYVFDGAAKIPSADIGTFLDYIRDLKGGVRSRLRETAAGLRKKDMEDGEAGFPAQVKDKEEKQRQYEDAISRFLEERKAHQQTREQGTNENSGAEKTNNKRSFDEVELVLRTVDADTKQRLLKRIRAEMVLEELSDSDETTSSSETPTTASSAREAAAADNAMDLDSKPSNGAQPKAKRRRVRNARTAAVEDSSSESESESESGSDSSSSGSSSSSSEDESGDEEMAEIPGPESSSSSSSSSSSESEDAEDSSDDDDSDKEED